MPVGNNQLIETLYHQGYTFDHYSKNMTQGHERYRMAMESIEEYSDEMNLDHLRVPLRFLVIAQLDCTDCAVAVPAFATLAAKIDEWDYRIVYKDEMAQTLDYQETFGVGGKQTVPQILILDTDLRHITRWFDKSYSKKRLLKKYTDMGLVGKERKEKIAETPELNIRYEAKMVISEIISLVQKAVYYL
ncbi:MAG: hypothetical protein D6732_13455 [Methanobacteriota archaeon]|nr:MAG: hypothetical protein D6732_13455 [Euryarchaeota archaeon]